MLIDEIIKLLSSRDGDLEEAFLKTKVLLHGTGNPELTAWIADEIDGYPDVDKIPPYRIIGARVYGQVANVVFVQTDYPLPVEHLTPQLRDTVTQIHLDASISALMTMGSSKALRFDLPVEMNAAFAQGLAKGVHVNQAWRMVSGASIKQVLTAVRSRLLNFLLELRGSLDTNAKDSDLKETLKTVDAAQMFSNAVFGQGTTIVLGNNNIIAGAKISQGDLTGLLRGLRSAGVTEDELEKLVGAIDEDKRCNGEPSIEGKTGHWLLSLLARAAKGGYTIGVDVVSEVVSKSLTSFITG